jgi:hypothetical protein
MSFFLIIMLVKYASIDGIPQAFLFFPVCWHNRHHSSDAEKNSLCVYVRYEYTEWRHWSRAAREL